MKRSELTSYLENLLHPEAFAADVSNNGLQVEGAAEVTRIIAGVDGCMALFRKAAEYGAQMVIVHHGISWGSEPRRFTGITAARLKFLLENGISLYAMHLPLDAHPQFGNNANLCRIAGMTAPAPCCPWHGMNIGFAGELTAPVTLTELAAKFGGSPRLFGSPDRVLRRAVAVSGGGGNTALEEAVKLQADVLITGEFTHTMYHEAEEQGIAVLALGHYASEVYGVQSVLENLKQHFPIEGTFVDIPTGR